LNYYYHLAEILLIIIFFTSSKTAPVAYGGLLPKQHGAGLSVDTPCNLEQEKRNSSGDEILAFATTAPAKHAILDVIIYTSI